MVDGSRIHLAGYVDTAHGSEVIARATIRIRNLHYAQDPIHTSASTMEERGSRAAVEGR